MIGSHMCGCTAGIHHNVRHCFAKIGAFQPKSCHGISVESESIDLTICVASSIGSEEHDALYVNYPAVKAVAYEEPTDSSGVKVPIALYTVTDRKKIVPEELTAIQWTRRCRRVPRRVEGRVGCVQILVGVSYLRQARSNIILLFHQNWEEVGRRGVSILVLPSTVIRQGELKLL